MPSLSRRNDEGAALITVILSEACYRFVEEPVRRGALRRWFAARSDSFGGRRRRMTAMTALYGVAALVLLVPLAAVAFVASALPAAAAVTLRGIVPEDGPRAGWFERYSEARQGPEQVEKFTQSYKVGDGATLDLSQLSGDIRVTGGGGSEIKIEATKRVRHRDPEEAKRLLAALRIEVNNFNGRVEVRTIYPRRGSFGNNISASVDFVIAVPVNTAVSLKSISGDVSVTGLEERDGRWVNPQATTSSITVDFEVQRAIGDLKIIAE